MCEIEPATGPDLTRVRRQIAVLAGVADSFLVPDNHLGRATVSSIAVAQEVAALGAPAVACVNSRDRNLLGFRRDLLTAAAYGVNDFLFVRGDEPSEGTRSTDLTVRRMIDEAHAYAERDFRVGATLRAGSPVPDWKTSADFLLVQVNYDIDALLAWRESITYTGQLFAGVMVMASSKMAQRIAADVPEIGVPDQLIHDLETDRDAGVDLALTMIDQIRSSGAFDGVHFVPVGRYADIAARLRTSQPTQLTRSPQKGETGPDCRYLSRRGRSGSSHE
ncbi:MULTISPECIES: methylenetetrahydrofolate reductase [unclassified Frankia]|uniref:methylenetetrahydrofolate reductase n=1 Tax=unclassified Frankia TaxID=2632575 RepID=UPI002AD383DC|nr:MULTISPECIES: methylenetetrahydrofolate reductase [unclassified Frankia]